MTTSYEIEILGRLWWPQCLASTSAKVTQPMEFPRAEGETDAEYEIRMVECAVQTGDFSSVIAMQITRLDEHVNVIPFGNVRQVTKTYTIIQAFDEDQEHDYMCCFPDEG